MFAKWISVAKNKSGSPVSCCNIEGKKASSSVGPQMFALKAEEDEKIELENRNPIT